MSWTKLLSDFKTKNPGLVPEWTKGLYLQARGIGANRRALPDFLVIGAQKSGSTSLFNYISMHPKVLASVQKEIFFFNRYYERGALWYRRFFPFSEALKAKDMITGEASTTYLSAPEAPGRVAELHLNVRLIAVLRDPVKRAISHYFHCIRTGRESRPIEDVFSDRLFDAWASGAEMDSLDRSYLENGRYAEQIERWQSHLPETPMLILQSDRLFAETQTVLKEVFEFLGLEPFHGFEVRVFNQGEGNSSPSHAAIIHRLERFYAPENARLEALKSAGFTWNYEL